MPSADSHHNLLPVQEIVGIDRQTERYNAVQVVKQVPTQETVNFQVGQEHPYENAQITLGIINPEEPPLPIKFSATYVLESGLQKIDQLDTFLEERTGKTIAQTEDLTIVRDPFGQEQCRVAPIIFEKWTDENGQPYLLVADGNTRLYHYLSKTPPESFCAIIVEGVAEKYRPVYKPVDVEDVVVTTAAPPLEKKRRMPQKYNPASYQNNRPDFTIFGSQGPRSSAEEMINNSTQRPLVEQTMGEPKPELADKIKRGFDGYAPPPHEMITVPRASDNVAEVLDFRGITPVCKKFGMANFVTDYGDGVAHDFKLLVKTKEAYEATATRGTLVVDNVTAEKFANSSVPITDEFSISPQMQEAVVSEMSQHDVGIPTFQLASSENPSSPRVIEIAVDNQNNAFYSTIILRLSNQKEVPIVLNRPKLDNRGRLNFGTVTLVRDQAGDVLLGYRHREPLGVAQLEAFRMYGFNASRLARDLGQEIVSMLEPVSTNTIAGLASVDNTPTTFDIYKTNASSSATEKIPRTSHTYVDFSESTPPIRMSADQVHQFIAEGRFGDAVTIAALTINQLSNNEIDIDPQFEDSSIIMEEVFNPLSGNQLVVPRLPLNLADRFSPMNVDMGKTLDIEYSSKELTVQQLESVSSEKRLVPLKLSQIKELVLSGKIDYNSLAHLSVLLRRQGVWKLANHQS